MMWTCRAHDFQRTVRGGPRRLAEQVLHAVYLVHRSNELRGRWAPLRSEYSIGRDWQRRTPFRPLRIDHLLSKGNLEATLW